MEVFVDMENLTVIQQPTGPVQANCYIVLNGKNALMIDPGDDPEILKGMIATEGCTLQAILLTHAHFDHCGAVDELVKTYGVNVYMNPAEFDFLNCPAKNSSSAFAGVPHLSLSTKPMELKEGEQKIGDFDVTAYYAPGHSVGSTIIEIGDNLFTGDVLFQDSIGRTDLETGSAADMRKSLEFLKSLTKDYTVWPGHGPSTTLDYEKRHNPFLIYPLI